MGQWRRLTACVAAVGLALASGSAPARAASAAVPANAQALSDADTEALLAVLDAAGGQGLPRMGFDTGQAKALLAALATRAAGQARLAALAISYASAQHGQRLTAARFPSNWAIRPPPYDAERDFALARDSGRLAAWAAALPPPDPRYARLVQVYKRYAAIAARGGWPVLSGPLKPGVSGPAVRSLLDRLRVEDPAVPASAMATYDAATSAAVARAQARYGLDPTGTADKATIAALNVSASERLGQIRANLERWRWLERALPPYRVELNIAAQELILFDGGAPAMQMHAIVGRPNRQTPSFRDAITAVVFNPPWNVPSDIAANEIWPKARRDPGYLARNGYVVRPGGGLQQLPGPGCALGAIKFDLSNHFGVYMHDTPTRSLFAQDLRLFSHGCMRLEHPKDLAVRVLKDNPSWPESRIDSAIENGKTVRAPLFHPVPVYVLYWTAFVDEDGQVAFRGDVYGWDRKLLTLLGDEEDRR